MLAASPSDYEDANQAEIACWNRLLLWDDPEVFLDAAGGEPPGRVRSPPDHDQTLRPKRSMRVGGSSCGANPNSR